MDLDSQDYAKMHKDIQKDTLDGNAYMYQKGWEDTGTQFWGTLKGMVEAVSMWLDLGFTMIRDGSETYYAKAEYKYGLDLTSPAMKEGMTNHRFDKKPDPGTTKTTSLDTATTTKLTGKDFELSSEKVSLAFSTAANPDAQIELAKDHVKELDAQTLSQPNIVA